MSLFGPGPQTNCSSTALPLPGLLFHKCYIGVTGSELSVVASRILSHSPAQGLIPDVKVRVLVTEEVDFALLCRTESFLWLT